MAFAIHSERSTPLIQSSGCGRYRDGRKKILNPRHEKRPRLLGPRRFRSRIRKILSIPRDFLRAKISFETKEGHLNICLFAKMVGANGPTLHRSSSVLRQINPLWASLKIFSDNQRWTVGSETARLRVVVTMITMMRTTVWRGLTLSYRAKVTALLHVDPRNFRLRALIGIEGEREEVAHWMEAKKSLPWFSQ